MRDLGVKNGRILTNMKNVERLQEGVGAEAAAFSAHEQLDNLIIMYDSNDVTLDKMAEFTMSEDTAMRYTAYGWDVVTVDGHDLAAVAKVRIVTSYSRNYASPRHTRSSDTRALTPVLLREGLVFH